MQQEFIKALAKEVLQPKTITKLPKLIKDLNQYVETNMKVTDMLRIASWAPGFSTESIIAKPCQVHFMMRWMKTAIS